MQKESVQRKIDFLKKDIQYLIDKKKRDKTKKTDAEVEKQQKLLELESLTQTLADLENKDRLKQKGPRGSGVVEAKSRENAEDKYAEYLLYEKEYSKFDPPDLPGFLFLHGTILEKYGLCPHIKPRPDAAGGGAGTCVVSTEVKKIKHAREDWLSKMIDKGQSLYDLRDRLVHKRDLTDLQNQKVLTQSKIQESINLLLTESQYTVWESCLSFIEEYNGSSIKTKKLKERFNHLINDLSVLFSETELPIHKYLSCLYKNIMFVVNNVDNTVVAESPNGVSEELKNTLLREFEGHIGLLKSLADDIQAEHKNIETIMQNLKNEMQMFVTEQKTFNQHKKITVVQRGKYFKRWSALTQAERLERFTNYADYFVEKFMIDAGILDQKDKDENVQEIIRLLHEGYLDKSMTYRHFKWNFSAGIIDSVDILKYNQETRHFYLLNTKTKTQETKATVAVTGVVGKRKSSAKSVITSSNEAMINEIILTFVVRNMAEIISNKITKEDCAEIVKQKLYLKKLSADDKSKIYSRYTLMTNTVNT